MKRLVFILVSSSSLSILSITHDYGLDRVAPVCLEKVTIKNMGIMEYLRIETRRLIDPKGNRWALFDTNSPTRLHTSSLLRLSYRPTRTTPLQTITGCLVAIRRNPGDPTFIVRSVVDGITVDQTFCLFSPLLESIEVLATGMQKPTQKKFYNISAGKIMEMQKNFHHENQADGRATLKPFKNLVKSHSY